MNDLLSGIVRIVLRLIVIVGGVVVFLSVLAAAMLLALVWGARALWARLTGQPVMPWAMKMDPRSGWSTVYRSTGRWSAPRDSSASSSSSSSSFSDGESRMRGAGLLRAAPDVTDVQAREVR
ncbi:hypothetical protein [Diaphorobacter aerolatus]|uniref:Uncharacterized protein n=1 Tax=Diaphorobacter aerolatus TaxID=1288495 RepID=A0A7H0GN13_9BURK|nr:hypothetical protein [Diaphorobacter aerolatus]QNP49679.1 hypothetical protein H9K75_06995 [Diaphorobacter aerolatus]